MEKSLAQARALREIERAMDTSDIWETILALTEAVDAMTAATVVEPQVQTFGLMAAPMTASAPQQGIAPIHTRRAQGNLLRAGVLNAGDLTDTVLREIANVIGSRPWASTLGPVYLNETVYQPDGRFYVCLKQHIANAQMVPGSEEALRHFRELRQEPGEGEPPLDFVWGERVPYTAIRRDPEDGKYYTPTYEQGVTLYEPHFPHLVPGEYQEVAEPVTLSTEPEVNEPPRWADLPDGHPFEVGDCFTDYSKTYMVTTAFTKEAQTRPPALLGESYKQV